MWRMVWITLLWAAVVAAILVFGFKPIGDRQIDAFEREHKLVTSADGRRFLRHYLTTGRRLRRTAFVGVVVVPPLVTVAVGGEVQSLDLVSIPLIVGFMVATLAVELTMGRPAASGARRAASLRPRHLGGYLSRTLRHGPSVVGVVASATWLHTLTFADPGQAPFQPNPSEGEVALGLGIAIAGPVLVVLACRWIVRRPQPLVDPLLVAADDAVRTASVRRLAGMGCVVALLNLATAVQRYQGPNDTVVLALTSVIFGMAWVCWLARAWGPAMAPAPAGATGRTSTASAAPRPGTPA